MTATAARNGATLAHLSAHEQVTVAAGRAGRAASARARAVSWRHVLGRPNGRSVSIIVKDGRQTAGRQTCGWE